MKTKAFASCSLVLMLVGCAEGLAGDSYTQGELAELEQGCDALLDAADEGDDILIGRVDGTTRYIVQTPDGRCLSDGDALLEALYDHGLDGVASDVSDDILLARKVESEPFPHPDVNHNAIGGPHVDGTLSADPMPHPDRPRPEDASDPGEVVVIWVAVERGK